MPSSVTYIVSLITAGTSVETYLGTIKGLSVHFTCPKHIYPLVASALFSPLLKGYFHIFETKIFTSHLLSSDPKNMYSSLSLHLPYY